MGVYKYQSYHELFETLQKMKLDKNADMVYFDLIYPSEKRRENSKRGQKMSAKICQMFLYGEFTLKADLKLPYCVRQWLFHRFVVDWDLQDLKPKTHRSSILMQTKQLRDHSYIT